MNYKILKPCEQEVFFQDCQFDPDMTRATDPKTYLHGRGLVFYNKGGETKKVLSERKKK